jgi:signal transduction histidine kinase
LRAQLGRAGEAIEELDRARGATTEAENTMQLLDLASLVGRRARAWSHLAPAYGSRLRLSWRAGPVALLGSRSRIEKAVDNLIANALEHGGGEVVVEAVRCGTAVRISIWDSGTGLDRPPNELLARAPTSTRGHGLAIARSAIEWHGGRLSAVRRAGGTAVDIQLPIETVDESPSLRRGSSRTESRIRSETARAA